MARYARKSSSGPTGRRLPAVSRVPALPEADFRAAKSLLARSGGCLRLGMTSGVRLEVSYASRLAFRGTRKACRKALVVFRLRPLGNHSGE